MAASSQAPLKLDPLKLHTATAPVVQLPRTGSTHQTSGGSGDGTGYGGNYDDGAEEESGDNNPWARRQFSVLWAPLPGDYEGNDDSNGAGARAYSGQSEDTGLYAGGPCRAYSMTTLHEAVSEKHAPFVR